MDKESASQYWLETAEKDYQTLEHLLASGDYHWALFLGHLVIEKLLKAIFIAGHSEHPPRIHDLVRLAQRCELKPEASMLDKLEKISRYNIAVRYPDAQLEFYRMCTKDFTEKAVEEINEVQS